MRAIRHLAFGASALLLLLATPAQADPVEFGVSANPSYAYAYHCEYTGDAPALPLGDLGFGEGEYDYRCEGDFIEVSSSHAPFCHVEWLDDDADEDYDDDGSLILVRSCGLTPPLPCGATVCDDETD